MTDTTNPAVVSIVSDLLTAEREFARAKERLDDAKARAIAFTKATEGSIKLETAEAKVAVYATGGSYIDTNKLKDLFRLTWADEWETHYIGCLSPKSESTAVRLTIKR